MKAIPGRILFDLVLLAGTIWGLQQAFSLPPAFGPGQLGASDFPIAVLSLGLVALLVVLWQDIRAAARHELAPGTRINLAAGLGFGAVCGLLAVYIMILEALGFLVSTGVFLFLSTLVCTVLLSRPNECREWMRAVAISLTMAVVATGTSYLVFTSGFGLIFP